MDWKGIQPYIQPYHTGVHSPPNSFPLINHISLATLCQELSRALRKWKKRLGLEHSNKKGIHVKKKKEMQLYKCKNGMRTSHRNDPRARLWSMNTPWPLEMHVAGKQTNSIHPASQLPNFGIKVHLSLCPFQVLWSVSPKMECPGRWLWQLCSSPVSYCLVLEWENGVSTKKKCEYSMETCRSSYFFQQKIFTQHFKYHS